MTECGPAIQLCEAGKYVCQQGYLVFQILDDLWPAVSELKDVCSEPPLVAIKR